MRTNYSPVLIALLLALAVPATSNAAEVCKHRNLVGLFTRLATPHFDPTTKSDNEIVGGFWEDLKDLKDAAHDGDASLQEYAATERHQWMLGYGTADALWATLNSGDYYLRDTLRQILVEYHRRETAPDPTKFLAAQARCDLGRNVDPCDCGGGCGGY